MKYDHKQIEVKWQKYWEDQGIFHAGRKPQAPKKYVMDMFSYPSGDGLHTGHPRSYTAVDIFARYYWMTGHDVLHPVGWDAFGLPAENYAIKVGIHPAETTVKNISRFTGQLKSLGFSYDWSREINTSLPEYYKWTQWLFKTLLEAGYAYEKEGFVNWCPRDKTVLANEQVVAGKCERCGSEVERRAMNQWFFKITEFADELLIGLDKVDWPESTVESQRNWIGRSEGAEIDFEISGILGERQLKVFTTRPDTLAGATFLVVAPELAQSWIDAGWDAAGEVKNYVKEALSKLERERLEAGGNKTGVSAGIDVTNPLTGQPMPVWVADYVLGGYGTGAVMAVPAHDERDFAFANKFSLPITKVVGPADTELPWTGFGRLVNSGEWDGLEYTDVLKQISEGKYPWAASRVQYKLRDWSVARQRYWGAPIPVVYDAEGKPQLVSDEDLPVLLPMDVDFTPTGEPPLAKSEEFQAGIEAKYGKGARRSVETLDTFVCSSWYFLRYLDPRNEGEFAGEAALARWMPVDLYVGGPEHTNGHLLYSRFIVKALHRLGYLDFDEPFLKLRHQGLILAANGEKMSKSRGNVVNPDELIEAYGADTLRMYEMFMGPFDQNVAWDTNGVSGVRKFLDRFYAKAQEAAGTSGSVNETNINLLIRKVTQDLEGMKFNTIVSSLMQYLNNVKPEEGGDWVGVMTKLAAPMVPHLAEEVWQNVLGNNESVFEEGWPVYDDKKILIAEVTIAVQEKGKLRGTITLAADSSEQEVLAAVKEDQKLAPLAEAAAKHIFVANKIINFI